MYPNFGKPTSESHDFAFGTGEIRPIQHTFDSACDSGQVTSGNILADVQNAGTVREEDGRPIQNEESRPIQCQLEIARPIQSPSAIEADSNPNVGPVRHAVLETEPIV